MESFLRDLRFSWRLLVKSPLFTISAVITLAVSIGASSAIFSIINAVLLRPLPYPDSDRLVRIYNTMGGTRIEISSWPDILDWREQSKSFEQIEAFGLTDKKLTESNEHIACAYASEGFFQFFKVQPVIGATFTGDDYFPYISKVSALGEKFWRGRFGGDPNIIGQSLVIDGTSTTIMAVIPDRFKSMTGDVQVWIPFCKRWARDSRILRAVGRLNPGGTLDQAGAELSEIAAASEKKYKRSNSTVGITLVNLDRTIIGNVRPMLLVLLGVVGLVGLIACASVANLLLSRASTRTHEVAVRSALGAGKGTLLRQFLTEGLLLGGISGLLGLAFAVVALEVLVKLSPGYIPRLDEARLDLSVIGFTVLLSFVTTLLFGLAPAAGVVGHGFNIVLKQGDYSTKGNRLQSRTRSVLVIAELALALVLLIASGLLIRSFYYLRNVQPGFNPGDLTTVRLYLAPSSVKFESFGSLKVFSMQLLDRLSSLGGSQSVAMCDWLPLDPSSQGLWAPAFALGGADGVGAERRQVSEDYFHTMQIPILMGREFNSSDGPRPGGMDVIISRSLGDRLFPNEDAVGKPIKFNDEKFSVCGVVGDIKRTGLDNEGDLAVYIPVAFPERLVIRAANGGSLVGDIKELIHSVDSEVIAYDVKSMDQVLNNSLAERRFVLFLLSLFAALALFLSAVGTYGVVSYSVASRTREIGLRMALGADRAQVTSLVLSQALKLAAAGTVLGLVFSFALTRTMSTLLFRIGPRDPVVFLVVSSFLVGICVVASFLPARRATRIDPSLALRHE